MKTLITNNNSRDLLFEFGLQDILDIMSFSGLEEHVDYLVIDGRYVRQIVISGYPYIASSGWLNNLINFSEDIISFHIYELEAIKALPKLNRKITELESTKRSMMRSGHIIGPDVTDPLEYC